MAYGYSKKPNSKTGRDTEGTAGLGNDDFQPIHQPVDFEGQGTSANVYRPEYHGLPLTPPDGEYKVKDLNSRIEGHRNAHAAAIGKTWDEERTEKYSSVHTPDHFNDGGAGPHPARGAGK